MSKDDTRGGPYGRAARSYRAAGWSGVLPIGRGPRQKYPPPGGKQRSFTGHGAPDPSGADVETWLMGLEAEFNIGLRLPAGVIGLDVDAYGDKRGGQSLAELISKFGPLPPTWTTSARTDGVSGIRLFRVPLELDGREINWPGEAGKHIEIIQTGHRYAVVWPSVNPEAGDAEYRWRYDDVQYHDDMGIPRAVDDLPWLPEAWVRGLALPYDRTAKSHLADSELASWWDALRDGYYCPPVLHMLERSARALAEANGSRHETARDALASLARLGGEGHRAVPAAIGNLAVAFEHAVGADRAHGGEWARLLSGAVKLAATDNPRPQQHCEHDAATPITGPEGFDLSGFTVPGATHSPDAPLPSPGALNLPDHFWQSRESLKRIRQAAHSRVRSGDVVFYGMLCRLAAMAPHTLRADTGIGSPASLNLFSAVVGPSGGGKSSGLSVSRSMVKAERALDEFPLGSGEGIAEAFMGEAEVPTGEMDRHGAAKLKKVRQQVRHNALFHADEGNALNKLIERVGSTVGETLRTAWSGETIGQKNGRVETTRTVPAGSYAAGMVIGYQPSTVLPLLADVEAGTPQRFLFCWAVDPSIPGRHERVPWPGEMASPFPANVPTDMPAPGSVFPAPQQPDLTPITFAASIIDELYDLEHAKNTGALPAEHPLRDAFRSQHPVLKVKVASLIALLEGRRHVTDDGPASDWALAQIVIDTSDAVRLYLQRLGEAAAREDARRADETHARRAVMAHAAIGHHEAGEASAAVQRLATALARKVHAAGDQGLARAAARKTVASSSRPLFGDALALAADLAWVVEDGPRVRPGPSLPAGVEAPQRGVEVVG